MRDALRARSESSVNMGPAFTYPGSESVGRSIIRDAAAHMFGRNVGNATATSVPSSLFMLSFP
jgi:hypothetical protein